MMMEEVARHGDEDACEYEEEISLGGGVGTRGGSALGFWSGLCVWGG